MAALEAATQSSRVCAARRVIRSSPAMVKVLVTDPYR
jgi:hypothetical protein